MDSAVPYTQMHDPVPVRSPHQHPTPARPVALLVAIAVFLTLSVTASIHKTHFPLVVQRPGLRLEADVPSPTARKLAVRDAMQFVWQNYHARAFGDEITPLDGTPVSPWGHVGCMILDSMDTLWIMDLHDEFHQAQQWVHHELSFDHMGVVSVFETIIRSVGGLLSAYDLSGDHVFLDKAKELADRMLPAINSTTGRVNDSLDTSTNLSFHAGGLAQSGSYQLEFEYLSRATGDPTYAQIASKLYPYLRDQPAIQRDGLFANEIYAVDGDATTSSRTLSLGAGGDSFYEYLLKVWIFQGEPTHALSKDMYLAAVQGIQKRLLQSTLAGHVYIADEDVDTQRLNQRLQHLTCFVPGLLALGARRLAAEDPQRSQHHMELATTLLETCYRALYVKQPTGLSPEYVEGPRLETPPRGSWGTPSLLRPEVVESLYVMYQLTGNAVYQAWGWQIFLAIERHCRTTFGFAQYRDVTTTVELLKDPAQRTRQMAHVLGNRMETFVTAETLKYLYLLFDEHNVHVNLNTHVFNTEAHPLSIHAR